MMKRLCTVLLAVAVSTSAWAQDDDDLAPLAPIGKPKAKPKAKPKPKAAPKAAPKAKARSVVDDDDDLAPIAPIAARGDVNVKVANGLSGAVLSIDGKEVGALPLPAQSVPSGEHTVTVKRPGYAAFVKKVIVPGGKSVDVDAKLTAVMAVLSVTSDVAGAQVLLNGRNVGTVPLRDVEVPPGPAELAVIKEGFREDTQKITFIAGKDYPVVVKFNPAVVATSDRPVNTTLTPDYADPNPVTGIVAPAEEPVTSKWYFWAGIAVAVAAVAVTATVVATQTVQPPVVITADNVCGMTCDGVINF